MIGNTGKLAGKTLFITGASRGIGKAIALKAARDGANIVIAAKTAKPHPKLPGTIYTAAKEVEDAGGKCLPCAVDIQDEEAVYNAVGEAVKKFGGIDILVNNASVINLTGTLETTMKKYDLMSRVNVRGTYLCLHKEPVFLLLLNFIILISTIRRRSPTSCTWLNNHETKCDDDDDCYCCFTAIATAAMQMLGGKEAMTQCRTDHIMADAAYVVLTRDSRARTGEFLVDEDVLKDVGVTDFEPYSCVPGSKLLLDFFLDDDGFDLHAMYDSQKKGTQASSPETASEGDVAKTFEVLAGTCSKELVDSVKGVFEFHLEGKEPGVWYLDLKNDSGSAGSGSFPGGDAGCTMIMDSDDFVKMFKGELNPTQAFMGGRLKMKGDMMIAMKLEKLMKTMKSKL
ncbi:PREDICTED: hydroxysteroid dehydrogenase-like protein 2 [Acropora digitifera]|uniref:hydroxysteroid dehydrogenase-like protein 2 n=1 Tax=Acropora digitifera TaxID=70779 RepID=UPI000779FF14|nr:PREDICTED: hydroxysteroid dehydrogenase-like protein 2 [Acropora digitifera]